MTKKNIRKKSNNIKKKAKRGFTLIEIIAVIIIIGILAIIMVPAVSRYVNRSKDTTYTAYEKNMKVATNNKVVECVSGNDKNCRLPDEGERVLVYLDELVENGYLDNLKDPEADGFCDSVLSYVQIENTGSADYEYKACLYCANYITDDEICTEYEKDEDKPTCGEINGASTKWTNANRTISVGCSDNSSGCRYTVFSKTFKETTKESTIKITDNSGNTNECPVEVYVDKDKPTCTLEVTGGTEEAAGWLSGNVQVKLTGWDDNESGVLTYGIGTSINNRNYNKQTSISVKQGLTTVIGYVKDYAGNEGVCSVDVRVGAPRPKFDVEYGYQIYPNKEAYTLSGITESGTKLTTTSTTPTISFTGLNNYKSVNRVVIYFNDPIPQNTTATIIHGTGETKGLLVAGQSKAEFLIPVGTYPNLKIVLGTLSGITYNIDEIELMVGDRTTLFTNKDVTVSLVPKEEEVRTTDYSFDNGTTWVKSSTKEYQENTTNVAKTKNIAELISDAKPISIQNIDKNLPTVTITAKKKTAGTTVASGVWSTEGLNFILTSGNVGVSGATIYYCQDRNNTCNPTTTVATGTTITAFNTTEDTYYIRYKVVSGAGTSSVVASYTAKVDIRKPTITSVTGNPTEWTNQNVTLTVNGAADNTGGSGLQASAYSFDNGATWQAGNTKTYTGNTSNIIIKVRDVAGNVYTHSAINITKVDKSEPTVTMVATKKGTATAVTSGTWSTSTLEYTFTSAGVGISGATIYYCKDTENTCTPNTKTATSGTKVTEFNTTENTYYIRYKVVSGAGTSSTTSSYTAKVDIKAPTITSVTGNPTEWTNQNVTLKVNGAADNTGGSGLQASAYSFDNGATWQAGNTKTYTGNTSNIIIKVRDVAGNIYTHPTINITKIDKSDPTVTMVATKKGTTTAVTSGTWSTSTLEYTFTSAGVGISGATIYYCQDTTNTCNPTTKTATSGTKVTEFNTTEDTYYIRYKVVSGAGTASTTSSYTAKVDIRKPTITSVTGNPTSWTNQNVTLKVNGAADNTGGSGLQASAYSFDNGTTWQSGNTKTYTANTSGIIIKVRDVAGNIYTHSTINITKIDKSAPTVTMVATKKGTTTAVTSGTWSTSTLEYTFTSAGVGISGATIYYCKDTANTCTPNTKTATSGTKVTEFNTTEGTYYIRYKIVSGAGTESTISSYTAKVDIKAPTITSVTGNPTSWTNQNVTLKVNGAADNTGGSGLQASAYSFDNGSTWQAGNTKTYTGNTSNIIIKVRDVAGNVYTHSAINITKVDKSEPTVTITAKKKTAGTTVATNTWSNQGLNFTFTSANVGSSGATIYHCKANSNSCTPNVSGTSTTAYNTTEGIYYIRYKIVSGAGYESEILSYTAKVDLTGPNFTVTGNPTAWTKNDVTLTVNATDTGSGLHATAYSFDGGSTWQTSKQKTYSSNQTVKIKVRDAVGNESSITTVEIGKIDKTPPTITSVTGNPTNWTNQNVTLTVNATDSQSGLNSSAYSFDDGATWQSSSSKTFSSNQTVKIKVRDAVGNISAATTVTINKIDKTAPECTSGGSSTSWTNSSRTITYGCSDATSGCNSSYSGGSKTFSSTTKTSTISAYEIRDNAGNVTNCPAKTVNVYVDKTAPTCTSSGENSSWTTSTITITYGCKDTDSGCNSSYSGGSKSVSSSAQTVSISAYEIRDKAGNITNCPARTANAYVDKNSPTCSFSYSTKEWTNQLVGVTFNAKDTGGSKIEYYTYTFNGSTTRAEVWNNEFSSQNVWENTSSPIVFRVYDAAGNSGSCSLSISNVDQENPTCTMSMSSTGWTNGSVTATIKGSDGISGVEYYRYGATGSWTTTTTKTVSDETDSNGTILFGYVKDKAGNQGSCNGIYKIDKTDPSCTITASGTKNNGWYTDTVTLKSTYSDGLSGVSEKGMGVYTSANYNGYSELTRSTDTDGVTFRCFVKDAAGNTSSDSITIKKDSTKPSVSLTMGSCTNGGYCSANATGSDSTSGVSYVQYCAGTSTCTPSTTLPSGGVTVRTGQYFCARAVDKAGNVGSTKCERAPCVAGSYMTSSGCSVCAAGTYSSSGATSCTKCPAGKYSSSGASSCTACPEGTYASGTGNTSCTTCPPAMFNTGTGNTTCDQCTAGYYCPGNNVKTKCPTGYTSDAGAAAAASCHMNVPAGKYLVAYASTATNCPSGKYKSTATKVFYGDSSSCDQCAAGRYASGTGNTSCTKCPAGTYTSTAGMAACSECPADTYASGTGNNKCLPCATGYSSSVGSSSCSDTTKPTCSWTHGSWGTSTTATIKGSDSGSGVSQISNGTGYISGSSTTRTFTAANTHTGYVKDAAGNTNTCTITIESRTRYRQRTCSTCKSCSDAGYTYGSWTYQKSVCYSSNAANTYPKSHATNTFAYDSCVKQAGTGNGCTVGQYYCKRYTRTKTAKTSCSSCGCSSWGSWTGYNYDSCSETSSKECESRKEYK